MIDRNPDTLRKFQHLVHSGDTSQKSMVLALAKLRLGSTEHTDLVNLYYRDLGLVELLRVLQSEQELR